MAGVEGLGQRVLAGARSPHTQALAADLDHLGMQVTPENVLQVRNVLKAEAVRLDKVMRANEYKLQVGPCGGDPVSKDAADGFTAKIGRLVGHCNGYIKMLDDAAMRLEQIAVSYGHSEQEIRASFDSFRPERPLSKQPLMKAPEHSAEGALLRNYFSPGPRGSGQLSPVVDSPQGGGQW